MKDLYVSTNEIRAKGKEWLKALKAYDTRKKYFEFNPAKSALMVIDMQEYFLGEKSHAGLPAAKAIVPNISLMLGAYREQGFPVLFTYHAHKKDEDPGIMGRWWGDLIWEGTPDSKIVSTLEPLKSETVIRKVRYSAFTGTDLEKILRNKGVESIVITGVMTHLCCESTAREAFMRDFEVYFVVDATASQYEELHLSSLRTLSDGFALPVTTDEILAKMEGK